MAFRRHQFVTQPTIFVAKPLVLRFHFAPLTFRVDGPAIVVLGNAFVVLPDGSNTGSEGLYFRHFNSLRQIIQTFYNCSLQL
jgi:hypothetical protein